MRRLLLLSSISSPVVGMLLAASLISPVAASSVEQRLLLLDQSMQLCLLKASRPGFPYYDRPEASEACDETKALLHAFGREASRNRHLGCSSRIAALDFDLWMIRFLGGVRMKDRAQDDLRQLARNCYNMNTRY